MSDEIINGYVLPVTSATPHENVQTLMFMVKDASIIHRAPAKNT